MALKALVTDINTVPEALRGEYVKQDDGTFILDVTDAEYKSKLDEFRTNNRALTAKQKTLEAEVEKFKGVDPAKYTEAVKALEKLNQLQDADAIKNGKLDEVLAKRTETMKADFTTQIQTKEQALQTAQQRLQTVESNYRDLKLNVEIVSTIDAVGQPRKGALPDIIARAKGEWQVDDAGKLVAKNPDGTQKYGKDGEPLTVAEWGKTLLTNAAHLFEAGQGGGANGGRRQTPAETQGKVLVNPTPQQMGKYAKQIASGEMTVQQTDVVDTAV